MDHPEKNIDWDKLLRELENLRDEAGQPFPEGSEEALQLQMAREMRARLLSGGPDEKFPDEEGWQRFQATLARRRAAGRRMRIAYWASAAAAATVLAVAGARFYKKEAAPAPGAPVVAEARPVGKVEIKSSNGRSVTLSDSTLQLQWGNGASVRASDDEIVYASAGEAAVTMDTLVVPRGVKTRILLADGSAVWMNAASRLIYPSAFTGAKREIQLQGEAFFDVAPDPAHPFTVHAQGMSVEVLGTKFNVNTYTDIVYATLMQGKVKTVAGGHSMLLQPGEQAAFDQSAGSLDRRMPDLRSVSAWKDGQLYFEDANLEEITNTLGRDYDYIFRFEDESLRQLSFTLDMPRPGSIRAVLEQISRTAGDVRFRIENNTVYLSR